MHKKTLRSISVRKKSHISSWYQLHNLSPQKSHARVLERDVWWCLFDMHSGEFHGGRGEYFSRPVIIMKKRARGVFLVLPLTTDTYSHYSTHSVSVEIGDGVKRKALLAQTSLIDVQCLRNKFAIIPRKQFQMLKKSLASFV